MKFKKFNEEVYFLEDEIAQLTPEIVDFLKTKALQNERRRCRVCTHSAPDDVLHEMFIMHMRGNYVPPHCHFLSDESLTALQGEAAMIYFSEQGEVDQVLYLDSELKGGVNYVRTPKKKIHSLYIETEFFLFKETTLGPFKPENMGEPEWAPDCCDEVALSAFMARSQELFLQAKKA